MIRDNSVDIAKGIGIILVVWGHTFQACPILTTILLFHMPLFFFLAGCFITTKDSLQLFLYKKIRTLILPFFCFYIGSFVIKILLYVHEGQYLFELLTNSHFYSTKTINYPLWFIVCLFMLSLTYYTIIKFFRNIYLQLIAIMTLSILGYIAVFFCVILPLYIIQALIVLPFIHVGKIYYQHRHRIPQYVKFIILFLSAICFIYAVILDVKTNVGDLVINPNPLLFYLPALGASIIIINTAGWLSGFSWTKFISKIGMYSMFIFAIHANMGFTNGVISRIVKLVYNIIGYTDYQIIEQTVLWGIIKVSISIPICVFIGKISKKYWPYLWTYSKTDKYVKMLNSNIDA